MRTKPHNEDALLVDWSDPPPWPVFIAINVLAGTFRAMADALTPPPIKMFDHAFAFQTSVLAGVCQSYKIPDFLATGPKTIQEIADYTLTEDAFRIERIMYAMAADGMTQLDPALRKGEQPRFVNTALSATMRRDHPNSVSGFVGHLTQDVYESFGKIDQALGPNARENGNLWGLVFPDHDPNENKGGIWKFFEDKPEREEQFGRAMWSLEGLGGKAMAADVPFQRFSRFIDIGGSLGHFLYKIMANNPDATGVLFDRPQVIANSKKAWFETGGIYNDGTQERLEMVEGDFFESTHIPDAQDGDVYIMRYILHDWGKEDCLKILSNLREKLKGKKVTIMIGECAIPDRDTIGVPSVMYKIDMNMLNVFGEATERTPKMWKELLAEAGFEFVAIHQTRSLIHFVEAVPLP